MLVGAGVALVAWGCGDEPEGEGGCGSDPCEHGTCTDAEGGGFVCACDAGWTGERCDVADEGGCGRLEADPPMRVSWDRLGEGGTATYDCDEGYILDGEATRQCRAGRWDGEEPSCVEGACIDHPCQNGGTCVEDYAGGYTCECAEGYEGDDCEVDIDDCDPDPCEHGGTCLDAVAGFACDCSTAPGWQGARCEEDSPDCGAETCGHGTCTEGEPGTGEHSCECDAGWEGESCSIVTDLCTPNPCEHGGACTMGDPGEQSCECAAGYEGDRCETNVDDCTPNPCLNGGSCTDGVDAFTCSCPEGWSGETCERAVSACADDPCLHATGCTDTGPGTYTCTCEAGWSGSRCEVNADECAPAPCHHGGTCIDGVASFACDCSTALGYEGPTCDDVTDLCTPNPCLNGGSCAMDGPGDYHCTCIGGYTGDHCETAPATTSCVLTYDLVVGNGNDGTGYTGCNMRIRDTFWGLGDGTHAVGPGTLVIRVPSDGAASPAPGAAEILYYELAVEFATSTAGTTITTDIDAFSPTLGALDNTVAQATGVLSLGATPTITWGSCTYPAGYDSSATSFTPDVVGTGAGCLAPYRSVGNVHCEGGFCGAGGLSVGDNPQDETWEQRMQTLTFTAGLASFSMPFMLVPNRTDSRTYTSWGGTLVSTVCE